MIHLFQSLTLIKAASAGRTGTASQNDGLFHGAKNGKVAIDAPMRHASINCIQIKYILPS